MKMPKLPQFPRRKKLRATATRRAFATMAGEYEEMSEPNMKLSRALLIVLLLHVVAVAGIIAFNAIKTRQASAPSPASTDTEASAPVTPVKSEAVPPNPPLTAAKTSVSHEEAKTMHSPAKAIALDEHKPQMAKPSDKPGLASDGKTYVVAKGENPVTIAKKLKVSYDDLLALNHVDDPRKLQIGQKLLVPKKTTKGKRVDE